MNAERIAQANKDFAKLEDLVVLQELATSYVIKYPGHEELKKVAKNLEDQVNILEEVYQARYADLIKDGLIFGSNDTEFNVKKTLSTAIQKFSSL
jgi:hypothetical protein